MEWKFKVKELDKNDKRFYYKLLRNRTILGMSCDYDTVFINLKNLKYSLFTTLYKVIEHEIVHAVLHKFNIIGNPKIETIVKNITETETIE